MAKKRKHRAIEVGKEVYISMCETCKYMPDGKIPRSNEQVKNGYSVSPHMMCVKKAFAPMIDYDNNGKPFYDVAECDSYVDYKEDMSNYTYEDKDYIPKRVEDDV